MRTDPITHPLDSSELLEKVIPQLEMLWLEADAEVRRLQLLPGRGTAEADFIDAQKRADHFRLALDWARASARGKQWWLIFFRCLKKVLKFFLLVLVILAFLAWWEGSGIFSAQSPLRWESLRVLVVVALGVGLAHGLSVWREGKRAFVDLTQTLRDEEKES